MVHFSKKEVLVLISAAVILGIVFGFDDGQEVFELSYWLTNLLTTAILSFITLIIYHWAHKSMAKKHNSKSTVKIWSMKRFQLATSSYMRGPVKSIWLGVIVPILLTLLSEGFIKFAAVTTTHITSKPSQRISHQFAHVSEWERAKITIAGPLAALLLALVATLFTNTIPLAAPLAKISIFIALINMLPIPTLDGMKVYFGSPLLFSFTFIFILTVFFLMKFFSPLITIIAGLIAGLMMFFLHYAAKFVYA